MMHTYEQCKIKIQGIKTTIESIKDWSKDKHEILHLSDSALAMCDELLREDINGKERSSQN